MEQWEWSAQHLLYVIKTFLTNIGPFSNQSAESAADVAGLDASQVAYFQLLTESKGLPPNLLPLLHNATHRIGARSTGICLTSHTDAILADRRSAAEVGDFNYEMVWGAELFEPL